MKHRSFIKQNLIFTTGLWAVLATGCIKEDLEPCADQHRLTLKVENRIGDDITPLGIVSNASLYIFDENLNYLETRKLDKDFMATRQEIRLDNYAADKKLHIIAWANMKTDNQAISNAKTLTNLKLMLKSRAGVAEAPDSLYFGYKKVQTATGGIAGNDTLTIRLKTGTYTIKTLGVQNLLKAYRLKSTDTFGFTVNRALNTYNATGTQTGDSVAFIPPVLLNTKTSEWMTDGPFDAGHELDRGGKQNIFASKSLSVTIYRNGQPLKTVYEGALGTGEIQPLSVNEGGRLDLQITFDESGSISVQMTIAPWGVIDQDVIIE